MYKDKFFRAVNLMLSFIVIVFICDSGTYEVTKNAYSLCTTIIILWVMLECLYMILKNVLTDDIFMGKLGRLAIKKEVCYRVRNLETNEFITNTQRKGLEINETNCFIPNNNGEMNFLIPFKKGEYRLEKIGADEEEYLNSDFEFEIEDKPFVFIYVNKDGTGIAVGTYAIEDL